MDNKNNNIMLIDDEPISAMVLKKYLTEAGYEVTYFNSATKAIEAVKTKDFPVIISDVNMPEMGGLAFLRWINTNKPQTDVILITGYATPQIRDSALKRGAIGFFEKPLDFSKLVEFINSKFKKDKFTGNIKNISLNEFIEMLLSLNKKRRVIIDEPSTGKKATIYIHEGKIVEAEYDGFIGEQAFNKIVLLNNGIFHDEEWQQPLSGFNINKSIKELFQQAEKLKKDKSALIIDPNNPETIRLKNTKKILIVEPDKLTRLIIEKYLSEHGYNCLSLESALEAVKLMTKEHFDLVISEIKMPDLSGIEFLLWIKNNFSRTYVIIMSSNISENIENFINTHGALGYYDKPINLVELDKFIVSKLLTGSFSGQMRDLSLLDYIKILVFDNSKKKIVVHDSVINKSGTIYISEGKIIYAEYGDLRGEEAFLNILKMEYGIFSDQEWEEPEENNIKTNFETLLMEAEVITQETNLSKKLRFREEKQLIRKGDFLNPHVKIENIKNVNIDDQKLGVYGLYIGKSLKQDVINVMKKYTNEDISDQIGNQLITFENISLRVLFNERGVIEEFNFGEKFKGQTYSGLSIGDTIEKAIQIYGKPITVTVKGAVWQHIACFSKGGNIITSIRLRGANFFDNTTTHELRLSDSERQMLDMVRNKKPVAMISDHTGLDYTIHFDGAMEIKIGSTNRDQVEKIMKRYSQGFNDLRSSSLKYIYDDISVIIIFDEKKIVREMSFGLLYRGKTVKGIGISSTFSEARKLYGKPRFENYNNLIWDKISVSSEDSNIIDSIRIQE